MYKATQERGGGLVASSDRPRDFLEAEVFFVKSEREGFLRRIVVVSVKLTFWVEIVNSALMVR